MDGSLKKNSDVILGKHGFCIEILFSVFIHAKTMSYYVPVDFVVALCQGQLFNVHQPQSPKGQHHAHE